MGGGPTMRSLGHEVHRTVNRTTSVLFVIEIFREASKPISPELIAAESRTSESMLPELIGAEPMSPKLIGAEPMIPEAMHPEAMTSEAMTSKTMTSKTMTSAPCMP
jgi:hypothetical protein